MTYTVHPLTRKSDFAQFHDDGYVIHEHDREYGWRKTRAEAERVAMELNGAEVLEKESGKCQ